MIKLENVSLVFNPGTTGENLALNGVSVEVRDQDFITIIGSNGAGKSTLFNVIAGTFLPTRGRIYVNDRDVTRDPEHKRAKYIGRIFQNPLLGTASNMALEDNLVIASRKGFKGLRISLNRARREAFRKQLATLEMDLENRMKDNVGLLSGGQRQALTLLIMVLSHPSLILLDEHTAALDPKNAQIVLDLTTRFISEYRLTAMMVTHNMSHAIKYGNRLLMLDQGEIILDLEGKEKSDLTVEKLVEKFHTIRRKSFESDEALLTND
ncbi:MAG TPA: ATP-binding cassette domain-containing protein [Spirochaetia bacterium]|nr:ATP-binding cassette domain-containing protein [Spirochaetia bacterium]